MSTPTSVYEDRKAQRFNVQCPRCQGVGRFDRGTCFECKGARSVLRTRQPKGDPVRVVVTFSDGSINTLTFWGFTFPAHAVRAAEQAVAAKGWTAQVEAA